MSHGAQLLASFYAACRITRLTEALPMTAATLAGMFLHLFGNPKSAIAALARMPEDSPHAEEAVRYLGLVVAEQEMDTLPATGSER